MSRFRQFQILNRAMEEDASSEVVVGAANIVDPTAAVEAVVEPVVETPPEAIPEVKAPEATEAAPEAAPDASAAPTATEAPAADAPAGEAEVNAPASTEGAEPAASEAAPAEVAAAETVPTAVPEAEVQEVTPTEGAKPEETPADTAPAAPAEVVPEATDAAGATVDSQQAAASAADAVQAPADTGSADNVPASTEGGEATPAENPEVKLAVSEDKPEDVVSLEELDAEIELGEDIRNESQILQELGDAQADDGVEEQLSAVLESLEVLQENAAQLIEDGTASEQTAQILEDAARTSLASVNVDLEFPAMESYGNDVIIRHQLVLENLDNYADRIRQTLDINVIERARTIVDQFKTYESAVGRIKKGIEATRDMLKKKKPSLQEKQHEGSLVGVGRFFNIADGNALKAALSDVKVSEYTLGKYPLEILKNIDKLNAVLSASSYKDAKTFGQFLKKVADIEPQSKVFKIGGSSNVVALLGNSAIVHSIGGLPKTLNYDDQRFPELAEAAKWDCYEQYREQSLVEILQMGGPYAQIGAIILGTAQAVYDVVAAHKVVMTTDEILKLLDVADAYADSCLEWSRNISKIVSSYQKLSVGMKKFSSIGSDIEGIGLRQRYRAWRLLGQVKTVIRNQLSYVTTPTYAEAYRSMMGARNCYYLAKRLALTAK